MISCAGEGAYGADDRERYVFPSSGYVWLANNYLQQLAGNITYILFSQGAQCCNKGPTKRACNACIIVGLLKTMLKLYNPFNDETTSFPEMAYGMLLTVS
jgi:hypothetical protein